MTKKLDIERDYFERFCRSYRMPEGVPEYGDKPDVLWKSARTIGVEITRFYIQSGHFEASEQRQKPLREAVLSAAHKLYLDEGGRGIELHIGFNVACPLSPLRVKQLPPQIAALARRIDENTSGRVGSDLFEGMPEIGYMYLNARDYSDARWCVGQVYGVEFTPVDVLREIIRDKETKAAEYKNCDSYWLLTGC